MSSPWLRWTISRMFFHLVSHSQFNSLILIRIVRSVTWISHHPLIWRVPLLPRPRLTVLSVSVVFTRWIATLLLISPRFLIQRAGHRSRPSKPGSRAIQASRRHHFVSLLNLILSGPRCKNLRPVQNYHHPTTEHRAPMTPSPFHFPFPSTYRIFL